MENNKAPINGGYPLHTFQEVEDIYMVYISSKEDRARIEDAYHFILEKHEGQTRKSGEPYYHHLIEVAYILASLQCGPNTIIAGLLHDVVEDTDTSVEDIKKRWGEEVSRIVDALTKIQRLKLSKITAEEFEAEDHRKIFLGMAKDIRVILIKLADRLHNLRTLGALSRERQIAICKETMEVFSPIAERLGLDIIKSEMEDLCIKYLEPEKYANIKKLLSKKTALLVKSLDGLKKRIADVLFEKKIPFEISSRVKSINSIYRKMYIKGHPFEEIYDILALRIITETEIQCYEILGLIHQMYKPVPGRFKDYIAMPKPNMYQSLQVVMVTSMKFKLEPKRWIASRRQALRHTGRIKKVAITHKSNKKKLRINYTGLENSFPCPVNRKMKVHPNTWITLTVISSNLTSMSLHLRVRLWNFLVNQHLLTSPIECTQKWATNA